MTKNPYFVVGGTSGIGRSLVERLHSDGASLIVMSPSSNPENSSDSVRYVSGDITDPALSFDFLPESLQGVVYCPGSIRLRPFSRLSSADFEADLAINFMGAVRTLQAALLPMKKSRSGASAVLFSTVAVTKGLPFHASIASAKGAIEGLVRSLAAELAPRVRINAVAPSLTDTPLPPACFPTSRSGRPLPTDTR